MSPRVDAAETLAIMAGVTVGLYLTALGVCGLLGRLMDWWLANRECSQTCPHRVQIAGSDE